MGDYIKELNIVDFLGITVPGCLLVLLISGDNPSLLLWGQYFGTDAGPGIRGIFLAIAGYVVGMILHEIGDLAENGVWCFTCLDPKAYAIRAVGIGAVENAVSEARISLKKDEPDCILKPWIRGVLGCVLAVTVLFLCTAGFPAAMNASVGMAVPQAAADADAKNIPADGCTTLFDRVMELMHGVKQEPEYLLIGKCSFHIAFFFLTVILAAVGMSAFLLWNRNQRNSGDDQTDQESTVQGKRPAEKGIHSPADWNALKALCLLNPQIQTYIAEKCTPKKQNIFDSFRHVMRNSLIAIAIVNGFSVWHPVDLYRDVALFFSEAGNISYDISVLTFWFCIAVAFAFSRYVHFVYLRHKYGFEAFVGNVMSDGKRRNPDVSAAPGGRSEDAPET